MFHSAYQLHPWWQADLGQDKTFDRLALVLRSDCCLDRNQLVVLVASTPFVGSDFASANLPATYSNGAQLVYETAAGTYDSGSVMVTGPFTGRYVRVAYKPSNNNYLNLYEVQLMQGGGAQGAGGVVQIYNAASGGSVITQNVIATGTSNIPRTYVGQPTTTGSYVITSEIAGIATATGGLAPELQYRRPHRGQGLE